jgi:hypothetical protein
MPPIGGLTAISNSGPSDLSIRASHPFIFFTASYKRTPHGENPRGFSTLTQSQPPRPLPSRVSFQSPCVLLPRARRRCSTSRHPPSPPPKPRVPTSSAGLLHGGRAFVVLCCLPSTSSRWSRGVAHVVPLSVVEGKSGGRRRA